MNPDARKHRDAARAFACLDLIDLGEAATDAGAVELCKAAIAPRKVAAGCVWPSFVALARADHLWRGSLRRQNLRQGGGLEAEVIAACVAATASA